MPGVKIPRFGPDDDGGDDAVGTATDDTPPEGGREEGRGARRAVPASRSPQVADVRRPKPAFTPDAVEPEDASETEPAGERPDANPDEYIRPAPPGSPTPARATGPASAPGPRPALADVHTRELARVTADVPPELLHAVADESRRRERAGSGGRKELALELFGLLPTRVEDLDQLLELVAAAGEWRDQDRHPRHKRLELPVPGLLAEHLDNLVSWVAWERGESLTKTDVVIAMVVAGVDLDRPPAGTGPGARALDELLAGYRRRG